MPEVWGCVSHTFSPQALAAHDPKESSRQYTPSGAASQGRSEGEWQQSVGSAHFMSAPAPNNPVELTAHSAGFLGCPCRCRLWAAAHRER
jgi:hypothetical protein